MNASLQQDSDKALAELNYDEERLSLWQSEKVALIEQAMKELNPRGKLADVGCFSGIAANRYRPGFDHVVGFDSHRLALDRAASRNIETRHWDGGAGPISAADGEFNFIVASNVIGHIFDTDAFIEELRRMLQPGGHLIVTMPNLAFWISRLRLLRGKPPWGCPGPSPTIKGDLAVDPTHFHLTTRREWQNFFERHSLNVERVQGWSVFHAIFSTPAVRAARLVDRCMTKWPDLAFGLMFVLTKPE